MCIDVDEKRKAAYALNLWTVSVAQIIDYRDMNILTQEYDTIMSNFDPEYLPKDEALLTVIKEIMDEVTCIRRNDDDRKAMDREYQHQLENAVWNAAPNIGSLFAVADNSTESGISLASQVGIGYMNYRRHKADYNRGYEKSRWKIKKKRLIRLKKLQEQLFETVWRLANAYEFPDGYRLTQTQISAYNKALMEENPVKCYIHLDNMKLNFSAYPAFWYQIGSTANSIYRNCLNLNADLREEYRLRAVECFEKYYEMNPVNLLIDDVLTSAWALEYFELQDMNQDKDPVMAAGLIRSAEKHSGNAKDVLELCAFAYLHMRDYDNAIRLFKSLVRRNYNIALNIQVLSGCYIAKMDTDDPDQIEAAQCGYEQLYSMINEEYHEYIIEKPEQGLELSDWSCEWNRERIEEELFTPPEEEKHKKTEEEIMYLLRKLKGDASMKKRQKKETGKSIYQLLEEDIMSSDLSDEEKSKCLSRLIQIRERKVNIMLVGATGSGKSSTINALFNMEVAKVGVGVDPETSAITCYTLGNLIIWDTPGLGDGAAADKAYHDLIIKKLQELDKDGNPLIDLVLVILDASSKDLGTSYDLINHVIIPYLGDEKDSRILIGMNQSDVAMKGKHWDVENNVPDEVLLNFLKQKANSVQKRIKECTGISVEPIYYCAGYKEEGQEQCKPYNLTKLFYYIIKSVPKDKGIAIADNINPDEDKWRYDDKEENYKEKSKNDILESIGYCMVDGAMIGGEIGESALGIPGRIIGFTIGGACGAVKGFFEGIFG